MISFLNVEDRKVCCKSKRAEEIDFAHLLLVLIILRLVSYQKLEAIFTSRDNHI